MKKPYVVQSSKVPLTSTCKYLSPTPTAVESLPNQLHVQKPYRKIRGAIIIATTPPGAPNLLKAPLLALVVEAAGAVADADAEVFADAVGVVVSRVLEGPVTEAVGSRDGDERSALLNVGIEDAGPVSVTWVLLAPEVSVVSPGIVTTEPLGPGEGRGKKNEDVPVL